MKNKKITLALRIICGLFILFIIKAMFFPGAHKASKAGLRSRCQNNLKLIYKALNSYSNDYDGCFPIQEGAKGLQILVDKGYLKNPDCLYCPLTKDKPEGKISYHYHSGFDYKIIEHDIAVCWDKENNHPNGINVLFTDSRVKGFENPDWKIKMLKYEKTSVSNLPKDKKINKNSN